MALKCEIYRDSMQNYKKYAIPPAQLIIADVPYNVTIRTVRANWRAKRHSIVILISIFMSIFISVQRCSKKMIKSHQQGAEVQTHRV